MTESLDVKDLGYELYSDQAMDAAREFGIAFRVDAETLKKYERFGIDLEAASNREHNQLPVPSVFLVAKGGAIRWVYSNDDYTIRPENDALLEAARKFGRKKS